jgi:hypothetical protein
MGMVLAIAQKFARLSNPAMLERKANVEKGNEAHSRWRGFEAGLNAVATPSHEDKGAGLADLPTCPSWAPRVSRVARGRMAVHGDAGVQARVS